ncbi:Uncharacterised protein [Collinsella intestinalis]|nr:Uncharacterised protein [Collinsella intestinalis]
MVRDVLGAERVSGHQDRFGDIAVMSPVVGRRGAFHNGTRPPCVVDTTGYTFSPTREVGYRNSVGGCCAQRAAAQVRGFILLKRITSRAKSPQGKNTLGRCGDGFEARPSGPCEANVGRRLPISMIPGRDARRPSCVGGHWTCAFGDGKRDGARMEMNEKKSHLRYPLGPVHMVSLQT